MECQCPFPPHWNITHYSHSFFAPETAMESKSRLGFILVHWVHLISVIASVIEAMVYHVNT